MPQSKCPVATGLYCARVVEDERHERGSWPHVGRNPSLKYGRGFKSRLEAIASI